MLPGDWCIPTPKPCWCLEMTFPYLHASVAQWSCFFWDWLQLCFLLPLPISTKTWLICAAKTFKCFITEAKAWFCFLVTEPTQTPKHREEDQSSKEIYEEMCSGSGKQKHAHTHLLGGNYIALLDVSQDFTLKDVPHHSSLHCLISISFSETVGTQNQF